MKFIWIICILLVACEKHSNRSKDNSKETSSTVATQTQQPTPASPVETDGSAPRQVNSPRPLPSCLKYCEDWTPNKDMTYNTLAFANFGFRGIGRCRGHTLLTQKLSQLIVFDQGPSCLQSEPQCQKQIKHKIRKAIYDFQVVTITGYRNLMELSEDLNIQYYLKAIVRGTSNRFNSRTAKIKLRNYKSHKKNLFYELIRRINNQQMPYIGILGSQRISSHALLAYDYQFDGFDKVCIEDSNIVADFNGGLNCQNYLYFDDKKDAIFYHFGDWNEQLFSINIYHDDEKRSQKYKRAWRQYCLQKIRECR